MSMRFPCRALPTFVLLALATSLTAQTKPAPKPAKPALPKPIADAFHQAYPAATILNYSREKEKGQTQYEVESKDGVTRRDLLYTPDGKVIEIEETVPASALPAPVQSAVAQAAPKAKITRAERVTRGNDVFYEISTKVAGKTKSFELDKDGKPVKP